MVLRYLVPSLLHGRNTKYITRVAGTQTFASAGRGWWHMTLLLVLVWCVYITGNLPVVPGS